MKLKLIIRPEAVQDLERIYDYLVERSEKGADHFADAVNLAFDFLCEFPGTGSQRRNNNPRLQDLRIYPIKGLRNYLILYIPHEHELEIVRLLHGARNLDQLIDEQ